MPSPTLLARRSLPPQVRARGVTAVLGPTNTGKTHLAIERMLGHESGMIGLPLRLLAREVYTRVVERVGASKVALVTGEEKIKPDRPRYWISTIEAMPRDLDLAFVAVDEIQLASDLDRGHVFTDRLLNQRGREETLLIGSSTMRPLVEALIPGVHTITRPRLSTLSFAGEKKISRLPPRTAIVAFSAEEVYAIAELIRRQRGGAAVVLGALSPRTRNAQVALYQSGDVDYLVATDAVGMGLNLDVDHVAFAADKKFDGFRFRKLFPAELGQIAGRAGRHMRDGTFGSSGRCAPLDPETVEALENHAFEPVRVLQWRNPDLSYRSIAALQDSLAETPREPGLTRAPIAEDVAALDIVARDSDIRDFATTRAAVERLWEVCQVPDYRRVSMAGHADLVGTLYRFLMRDGRVPDDWFARHVASVDRLEGDIDTLSNRIAQIRTWTFVANRPDWLNDPEHWQGETRQVEDRLSDALHERLAQRFVDRRTSVLIRRLRENVMLEAEITATGDVTVEGQPVGQLHGFHFVADPQADGAEAKALRAAAQKALAGEIEARAERFAAAADSALVLSNDGTIRWTGDPVAKLEPGEQVFEPRLRILADDHLTGPAREKVEARLGAWLKAHIARLLGPLVQMQHSALLTGVARGIAFQIAEALGVIERAKVLQEVRGLDQDGRAALRSQGVRFGAYHLYLPALLKPAPRTLAAQLWALKHGGLEQKGLEEIAHLASSGRTSIPVDPEIARPLYRAAGYRVCGTRAVRVDILERLADLIRPAVAYRPGTTPGEPPPGAADGDGFVPTASMTSLVGCSGEDFASILRSLGYVSERRPGPAITVPLAAAPAAPAAPEAVVDRGPEAADGIEAASSSDSEAPMFQGSSSDPALADEQPPASFRGSQNESPEPTTGLDPSPSAEDEQPVADAEPAPELVPEAEVEPDAANIRAEGVDSAGIDPAAAAELAAEVLADAQPPSAAAEAGEPQLAALGDAVPAETAAPENPPAAPAEIEVWRLNRHHREGERHVRQRRGRPNARADAPGREGRPRTERAAAEARPNGPRPPRPERSVEAAESGGAPGQRPVRPPRGPGRPEERRTEDRGPRREDRRDKAPGYAGEPRRREERRDKPPDPNSPFAKLLALKEQMQNRDGGKR